MSNFTQGLGGIKGKLFVAQSASLCQSIMFNTIDMPSVCFHAQGNIPSANLTSMSDPNVIGDRILRNIITPSTCSDFNRTAAAERQRNCQRQCSGSAVAVAVATVGVSDRCWHPNSQERVRRHGIRQRSTWRSSTRRMISFVHNERENRPLSIVDIGYMDYIDMDVLFELYIVIN
jgi:hypothetical protein